MEEIQQLQCLIVQSVQLQLDINRSAQRHLVPLDAHRLVLFDGL